MINTKLLAEICEVAGAPGHEQRVREIVLREIKSQLINLIGEPHMGTECNSDFCRRKITNKK